MDGVESVACGCNNIKLKQMTLPFLHSAMYRHTTIYLEIRKPIKIVLACIVRSWVGFTFQSGLGVAKPSLSLGGARFGFQCSGSSVGPQSSSIRLGGLMMVFVFCTFEGFGIEVGFILVESHRP